MTLKRMRYKSLLQVKVGYEKISSINFLGIISARIEMSGGVFLVGRGVFMWDEIYMKGFTMRVRDFFEEEDRFPSIIINKIRNEIKKLVSSTESEEQHQNLK